MARIETHACLAPNSSTHFADFFVAAHGKSHLKGRSASGCLAILLWVTTILLLAETTSQANGDWLSRHATLLVGVIGIVVSGFVGPTVTALFTSRRERIKDARTQIASRRDDLRDLLDEAAKVLGAAVANLRPLLDAEQAGRDAPREPAEFLGALFPLGQRLRLRLPESDPVVANYDEVRGRLLGLSTATASQDLWDGAVREFEAARASFLEAGRVAVQAPLTETAT